MASELRWILTALSVLLLVGIWWWGVRRRRISPGNPQLRETVTGQIGPTGAPGHAATHEQPQSPLSSMPDNRGDEEESHEWGISPFEPLSIRTADFDQMQSADPPMSATLDPLDVTLNMEYFDHTVASDPQSPIAEKAGDFTIPHQPEHEFEHVFETVQPSEPAQQSKPAQHTEPEQQIEPAAAGQNSSTAQRIITVRVCAAGDAQWAGADLVAALADHRLTYGRYRVFHRLLDDGRSLFCAASLVEPGTFDIARMADDTFRGLTLFAVLPGPADALETIDALLETAVGLADILRGVVQDSTGAPLSAPRAEAMRADVARFQQLLSTS